MGGTTVGAMLFTFEPQGCRVTFITAASRSDARQFPSVKNDSHETGIALTILIPSYIVAFDVKVDSHPVDGIGCGYRGRCAGRDEPTSFIATR